MSAFVCVCVHLPVPTHMYVYIIRIVWFLNVNMRSRELAPPSAHVYLHARESPEAFNLLPASGFAGLSASERRAEGMGPVSCIRL